MNVECLRNGSGGSLTECEEPNERACWTGRMSHGGFAQKASLMKLLKLLESIDAERDLSKATREQHEISLRLLGKWLGHPAQLDDLTEPVINKWLASLADTGRMPRTVLSKKRSITTVWNYASERGMCAPYHPRRLRKIRLTEPSFDVWSTGYVAKLLSGAEQLEGKVKRSIPASRFMKACLLVSFETGIRPSDCLRLKFSDIHETCIHWTQSKTGQRHCGYITARTHEAVESIRKPSRDRIFFISKSSMRHWVDKLFEASGLERRKGEALGQLRKSHCTEACKAHGLEVAARSLGHRSGTEVARKHYLAQGVLQSGVLVPAPSPQQEVPDG